MFPMSLGSESEPTNPVILFNVGLHFLQDNLG